MTKIKSLFISLLLTLGVSSAIAGSHGSTLDLVKERGVLKCGSNTGLAGFGLPNSDGVWEGIDVDVCRAVAAAVFGDASKVEFVPTTSKVRFTVLQSGEVDMLSRNTTWTLQRDVELGLEFVGVNYYDGQGFMVPASLGVSSASELDRKVLFGASLALNIAVAGVLAGAFWRHSPEHRSDAGGSRQAMSPYFRALEPEQRRAISKQLRAGRDEKSKLAAQTQFEAAIRLLRQTPFRAAEFDAVMQQQIIGATQRLQRAQSNLSASIIGMSAPERSAYADRLQAALQHRR